MNFMDDSHYDTLYDEDVAVFSPEGKPILVLLKRALDPQLASNSWQVLKKFNTKTKNRSIAIGIEAAKPRKMDGTFSNTSLVPKGWEVCSGIMGSFERTIRAPYAHHCAWNAKNTAAFATLFPLLWQTTNLFKTWVPERFEVQQEFCNRTHPAWVIPGSVYTTLTVNKNFRTAAHKDAGDLSTGFSNMFVIAEGSWSGANLVMPNWRIACKLSHLDFIMFDAQEFHGNTQLIKRSKDAVRCSVVCYYREKMLGCLSPEEELRQAKNRKPGQPLFEVHP